MEVSADEVARGGGEDMDDDEGSGCEDDPLPGLVLLQDGPEKGLAAAMGVGAFADLQGIDRLAAPGQGLGRLPERLGELTGLLEISLQDNQLAVLPNALGHLARLRELNIWNNRLKALPESIGGLHELRALRAWKNQLTCLPEAVGDLASLQELRLECNELSSLPESFGRLYELRELHLWSNSLEALPEGIGRLVELRELHLERNCLTALPEFLGGLAELRVLDLGHNRLASLPEGLGELPELRCLRLEDNCLTELPESLGQLEGLEELHLQDNKLCRFPEQGGQLSQLRELRLERNALVELPQSLGGLESLSVLHLEWNHLAELPASMAQLAQLRELCLLRNELPALPEFLQRMVDEQGLELEHDILPLDQLMLVKHLVCNCWFVRILGMSGSEIVGVLAGKAATAAQAIRGFAEKVEEAEMRVYEENSHWRGARNLHAAVRAPILACQGQRIHAINSISEALRCKATRGLYNMLDNRFKDLSPSEPSDERGVQTLVHRTSPEAGRSIASSRHMRCGREGTMGAGIYFAESAEACAKKAQIYGGKGGYALVTARVDLGRCRVVKLGELGWRMVRDCGFKKEELDTLGFSSAGTNFHGGWEYCVFDPDRVTVVEVTFHTPGQESEPECTSPAATPAQVPLTWIRASADCAWERYTPNPKVVAVIAPGAGMKKHAYLYKDLERQGYEVVPIFDDAYDHYPPGTDVLASLGVKGLRMPDLRFNRAKNLATFVQDVVHPRIVELISLGRGPAVVIAASRGGIISLPKLWACGWQGPSVVGNAGFVGTAVVPSAVPCVMMTAGWDCFLTRNPEATAAALQKEDPATPVLLYHDPREDHDLNRLQGRVLGRLVEIAAAGSFDDSASGPWPEGAGLRLL